MSSAQPQPGDINGRPACVTELGQHIHAHGIWTVLWDMKAQQDDESTLQEFEAALRSEGSTKESIDAVLDAVRFELQAIPFHSIAEDAVLTAFKVGGRCNNQDAGHATTDEPQTDHGLSRGSESETRDENSFGAAHALNDQDEDTEGLGDLPDDLSEIEQSAVGQPTEGRLSHRVAWQSLTRQATDDLRDQVLLAKTRWLVLDGEYSAHHTLIVLHHYGYEDINRDRLERVRRANGLLGTFFRRKRGMLTLNHPGFTQARLAMERIERQHGVPNPGPHRPAHPLPLELRAASPAEANSQRAKYWVDVNAPLGGSHLNVRHKPPTILAAPSPSRAQKMPQASLSGPNFDHWHPGRPVTPPPFAKDPPGLDGAARRSSAEGASDVEMAVLAVAKVKRQLETQRTQNKTSMDVDGQIHFPVDPTLDSTVSVPGPAFSAPTLRASGPSFHSVTPAHAVTAGSAFAKRTRRSIARTYGLEGDVDVDEEAEKRRRRTRKHHM